MKQKAYDNNNKQFNYIISENTICDLLIFENYVIHMPIFTIYTSLQPRPEVTHQLPGYFWWYCNDFLSDSSFQIIDIAARLDHTGHVCCLGVRLDIWETFS